MLAKFLTVVTIAFAAFLTSGCKPSDGKVSNGDSPRPIMRAENADPLTSFKNIAEKCFASLVDSDITNAGKNGNYVRTKINVVQKDYDVKKSDSLVSPYIAFIHVKFVENGGVADSETKVNTFVIFPVITEQDWHLSYAYQDGKWVSKNETYSFNMPAVHVKSEAPEMLPAGTLAGRLAAAQPCSMP